MDYKYIQQLQKVFEKHRDRENSIHMKAYMRNQFDFLGIRSPKLKSLTNEFVKQYGIPMIDAIHETIETIWLLPEREYQYFSISLLDRIKKQLTLKEIKLLEYLITQKSWWDTVDLIAPKIIGFIFSKYPEGIIKYNSQWINSPNIWLQRTAILFQLRYKAQTDKELLFTNVLSCKDSKEFFIQKAMGWALRELSKTYPDVVNNFVSMNSLPPLTKREALRVINSSNPWVP